MKKAIFSISIVMCMVATLLPSFSLAVQADTPPANTSVGGELSLGDGQSKAASRTDSGVFLDGKEVSLTAYSIGGNNYFKLRDVMQIFNIFVEWDEATSTATLTTNEHYALAPYEKNKFDAYVKAYEQASGNPYVPDPIYKKAFVQFQTTPSKLLYNVGNLLKIFAG